MVQEGSIIGSYRVVAKLGEGGMGTVWLAEHILLGRRAAIKVLQPSLSTRADIIDRFFREARTASTIADPGIVQVFDFGYHRDGSAFILMELLDGEPLDARLRRVGRLPVLPTLRIARQIAASLAAAHAQGIVHRDLKPANIVLVPDAAVPGGERAKLLDFGIAKLVEDRRESRPVVHRESRRDFRRTSGTAVLGTPVYMSPEQYRGADDLDHRSDIYSLGCLLFHMLVGRPPFEAGNAVDLLAKHLIEPAPAPSSVAAAQGFELAPELDSVVLCCLAKRPRDRFQNMAEVIAGIGLALPVAEGKGLEADVVAPARLRVGAPPRAASMGIYTTQLSSPVSPPSSSSSSAEAPPVTGPAMAVLRASTKSGPSFARAARTARAATAADPASMYEHERSDTAVDGDPEVDPTRPTPRTRRRPSLWLAAAAIAAGLVAGLLGGSRTVAGPPLPETTPAPAAGGRPPLPAPATSAARPGETVAGVSDPAAVTHDQNP